MPRALHCGVGGGGGWQGEGCSAEPDTDLPEGLRGLGPCLEIAGKLNT